MSTGGGRDIRAGKAFVELGVRNRLASGLNRASKQLKAFAASVASIGTSMLAIGTSILTPLLAAAKVFASMGDELQKMAIRTGLSVEALSELKHAAETSGSSAEALEKGLMGMARFMQAASRGGKNQLRVLQQLGISFDELNKLSPEDRFELLADKLSQIQDPTVRAALAMQLFGKSGTELIPLLEDGAEGIRKMREEARELGITMSKEDADAAALLGDTMENLWKQLKFVVFQVGAALAPALTDLVKRLSSAVRVLIDFVKANREAVVRVAKLAAVILIAGAILMGISAALYAIAFALSGIVTLGGMIASVFGVIVSVLGAIASPIGVAIAALFSLAAVMLYVSGIGKRAVEWLKTQFTSLWQHVQNVVQGIADALMSGEIMLAAQILWQGIKVAWLEGTRDLSLIWATMKLNALMVFDDIYFGAVRMFQKLVFEASKAAFRLAALMHEHLGIGNMTEEMADMAVAAIETAQRVEEIKLKKLEEAVAEARRQGFLEEAKRLEEEIQAAKKRLEELEEEARKKREESNPFPEGPPPSPEQVPGFGALAETARRGASAVGAFGAGGGRLGFATPGDAFKKMEKGIANIDQNMQVVANAAKQGGLVFAP